LNKKEDLPIVKKQLTVIDYSQPISKTTLENKSQSVVQETTLIPDNFEELNPSSLNLSLDLVEVIPPPNREAVNVYGGELQVSGNSLDHLILNMDEHFEISFVSLDGNTFEYQINGETYSGMLYQVDQDSYMVTLTNGSLEAYRFRFMSKKEEQNIAHEEYENKYDLNDYRGFYE
jgi:hypothetical protein